MLLSYLTGVCPKGYVPRLAETMTRTEHVDGVSIKVSYWDTAGNTPDKRAVNFRDADIFIICYSVNDSKTFVNAEAWNREVDANRPKYSQKLLVGTKIDSRGGFSDFTMLGQSEGKALAKKFGAIGYLECSAQSKEGLNNVFYQAQNWCAYKVKTLQDPTRLPDFDKQYHVYYESNNNKRRSHP